MDVVQLSKALSVSISEAICFISMGELHGRERVGKKFHVNLSFSVNLIVLSAWLGDF